ncbi:MAG: hypothetical protein HC838_16340 [Spirulinaceae cyanobacterium RM2_2_10]|nr:hypothetical protein [Spirulinaceae cyanobacterium RM2_2_10]
MAITALGSVTPAQALRRQTAQPGDAIVATGWHGASRAGLELLLHPQAGQMLAAEARDRLICAHQYPRPRFDVLPYLEALTLEHPPAAMDSSDGLADAVLQLCRTSGVGARLDGAALPMPPELASWLASETTLEWTLYGGEDFELVLCLPEGAARSLVAALGHGAAIIGQITAGSEVTLSTPDGSSPEQTLTLTRGFQHF